MHECKNCNTKYEGKFCPQCGTPWQEEKICPNCGSRAVSGARFCTECGFAFDGKGVKNDGEKGDSNISPHHFMLYRALRLFPLILFGVFALLLFPLYCAPVIVVNVLGFESEENVYEALGDASLGSLHGNLIALVVFGAVALAGLLVLLAIRFVPSLRQRIARRVVSYYRVVYIATLCVSSLVYLAVLGSSSAIFSIISAEDQGVGVFSAGGAPIALIVLGAVFFALSVLSCVILYFWKQSAPYLARGKKAKKLRS